MDAISSYPPLSVYAPKVLNVITAFIDALVNLSIDPNTDLYKDLNHTVFVLDDEACYESYKMFENPNFSKIISCSNLIAIAQDSLKDVVSNSKSTDDIATLLNNCLNNQDNLDLINILQELKSSYQINLESLLESTPETVTNKKLRLEDLFKDNPSEEILRNSANSLKKDFEEIKWFAERFTSHDDLIPNTSFNSIAQNKNIIPAYKILTLRPLVKYLEGWLALSEDDLWKQAVQELNSQLQQKAPEGYKANYEKLALAVFPQEVAGRLRAAGFGTQQQA
jgi:hypothetical protein